MHCEQYPVKVKQNWDITCIWINLSRSCHAWKNLYRSTFCLNSAGVDFQFKTFRHFDKRVHMKLKAVYDPLAKET